jgi:hypothetical protein
MKLLPFGVCYIIWEMCGKNACILNKDLIPYLEIIKLKFISSPLILKYRLNEFREIQNCNGYTKRPRPSIIISEDVKTIYLNGNLPIGEIMPDNTIDPSLKICDKIIPRSIVTMMNGQGAFQRYKIIYWTIFEMNCVNIKRAKIYKNIFN